MTHPERPRTTPEGHTPEEPRPSELGKPGTPGAGMRGDVPHAADARDVETGEPPAAGEPVGEAHAAGGIDATEAVHSDEPRHDARAEHIDAHAQVTDDDHAHAEPRLGPIDWPAWGYAVLGVMAGLLVVGLFFWAIGGFGA